MSEVKANKRQTNDDLIGSTIEEIKQNSNYQGFLKMVGEYERVQRFDVNRLARFKRKNNLLDYRLPFDTRLKFFSSNKPFRPLNLASSTYRAVLGWDISDDRNVKKIKANLRSILTKKQKFQIEGQEETNILRKQYPQIQKLYKEIKKKQSGLRKRLKVDFLGKPGARKKIRNFNREINYLLKQKKLLTASETIAKTRILRRLDQFGNINSMVNAFIPKKDENLFDKIVKYSEGAKGFVDTSKDIIGWVRKRKIALQIEKNRIRPKIKIQPTAIKTIVKYGKKFKLDRLITRSRPLVGKAGKFLTKRGVRFTGRLLSRGVGVLSFAADMSEVYKAKSQKEKAQKLGSALGGAAGAFAGAKIGAGIGTLIGGPVGTLIGGAIGGATGYLIGSGAGSYLAKKYKKQVLAVWNPIEKYTRKQWKVATTFLGEKWNATKKLWQKNKINILKYAGGASAALLTGGPFGLLSYANGSIAENLISNALQKPKKSSLNQDLQTANKVNSLYNVNNTNSIDCRQVAVQMISELNKILQNKVISHTANYA